METGDKNKTSRTNKRKKYVNVFVFGLMFVAFCVLISSYQTDIVYLDGDGGSENTLASLPSLSDESYMIQSAVSLMNSSIGKKSMHRRILHGLMEPEQLANFFIKHASSLNYTQTLQILRIKQGYKKRLPKVIIIGCKKCGTSYFRSVLTLHPNIRLSSIEPHFFDVKCRNEKICGKNQYRNAMPYSFRDQITMEKTPAYWKDPRVARALKHMLPEMKLILLVREPACRIVSDYRHEQRHHRKATLENSLERLAEFNGPTFKFLKLPSLYDKHMTRWLKYFNMSQFMIIRNEDLLTTKFPDILREAENFIGVPHRFHITQQDGEMCVSNRGINVTQCTRVTQPHCSYDEQHKQLLEKLRQELKPNVERFEIMINRTFHWYD